MFNTILTVLVLASAICASRMIAAHVCYDKNDEDDLYRVSAAAVAGVVFLILAIVCAVFNEFWNTSGFELTMQDMPIVIAGIGGILFFVSFILQYMRKSRRSVLAVIFRTLSILCFIAAVVFTCMASSTVSHFIVISSGFG